MAFVVKNILQVIRQAIKWFLVVANVSPALSHIQHAAVWILADGLKFRMNWNSSLLFSGPVLFLNHHMTHGKVTNVL